MLKVKLGGIQYIYLLTIIPVYYFDYFTYQVNSVFSVLVHDSLEIFKLRTQPERFPVMYELMCVITCKMSAKERHNGM